MNERRLLVLCYFYPPLAGGGVHRVLGFTRHLPDHGWSCTVVCAGPEDYWVTDDSLTARIHPATEVVRVAGGSALATWLRARPGHRGRRPTGVFSALRRLSDWWLIPDPYVGWAGRCRRAAARLLERGGFDAVLSTSPPDSVHLAALDLKRRFRLPWIADFRDPWMGLHVRRPPTEWHRKRQAALEQRVLSGADLVLAASRTHADRLTSSGLAKPERVVHLPNGFEPEDTPRVEATVASEFFRVAFTGTLAGMPDAEIFLEALHDLLARAPQARRRVRATIAGPFETGYQDRAIALGLTPGIVEFTGPRPHAETRAIQSSADLLLLWKPPGIPTMVPGKLYEYLDTGRPLIALLEPGDEAAELVRRAGGDLVAPGDLAGLTATLNRHYAAWQGRGSAPAQRPAWLDEHTRARLTARLVERLEARVAEGGTAS